MKKNTNKIIKITAFLLLFILILGGIKNTNDKKNKFEKLSKEIAGYENTTLERVNKSVITLPEDNVLVGLENGSGEYTSTISKDSGVVTVKTDFLKTHFVLGKQEKKDPRQDAVVPIYISTDSHGGSMYIMLFNDRGDVAIEKSYARLGGKNISINNIEILAPEHNKIDQEYRIEITYKSEGISGKSGALVSISKKVTIPVIDGHFDPDGSISE